MKTVTDAFEQYKGTKEYDGIVATIQRWYYGDLVKASWCATSMSYFANQLGILDQLGGKNENVYSMMRACEKTHERTGRGQFFYKKDIPADYVIPRGAVIFLLYSSAPMTTGSQKHVTSCHGITKWKGTGSIKCLGGNQSDAIRITSYSQENIYAIFVPDYTGKVREFVERMYEKALGRVGEEKGVSYWTHGLSTGEITGCQFAIGFYLGMEYVNRRRSNTEFLKDLYHGLFGREPDESGYNYWLFYLNEDRLTRGEVLKGFVKSAEFINICNKAGITRGKW